MAEPLILRVQADTQGVPEGFNRIAKSGEGLDISLRKASNAIKGFIQDLAEAKNGTDVASAALGAFSKILGTSLAATGVVIAGKAIIDSFQKVSTIVEEAKDRVAKASSEIKKSGLDAGFSQAAGEAKRLSDEAETARISIEKLDKSFLMGLVATITGAREELGKLAQEADTLSQQRLFEGARAERIRAEERVGLEGAKLQIKDIEDRMTQELKPFNLHTKAGRAGAKEVVARAEIEKEKIRQKVFDEFDRKQAQKKSKEIEAEISGAEAAAKIARKSDEEAAKQAEESLKKLYDEKAKREQEIQKNQEKTIKESVALQEKGLDAQDRVNRAREALIEAEGEVAKITATGKGSGRGMGQRKSSLEIGIEKAMERGAAMTRKAEIAVARQRIKAELRDQGKGTDAYAIDREIARRAEASARQAAQAPFTAQDEARKSLSSAESYLSNIEHLLKTTMDELKTYAHVR